MNCIKMEAATGIVRCSADISALLKAAIKSDLWHWNSVTCETDIFHNTSLQILDSQSWQISQKTAYCIMGTDWYFSSDYDSI